MAKRFTDTKIWDKAWFRKLPPRLKEAWRYLCDKCDHAGIWDIDMEALVFNVGETVEEAEMVDYFGLQHVGDDKYLIPGFIEFQYNCDIPGLNPANKVHSSVIERLKSVGVIKPLKGVEQAPHSLSSSPLQGAKDKEEEKELVKAKEKDPEFIFPPANQSPHPTKSFDARFDPRVEDFKQILMLGDLSETDAKILAPKLLPYYASEVDDFVTWFTGVTNTPKAKELKQSNIGLYRSYVTKSIKNQIGELVAVTV